MLIVKGVQHPQNKALDFSKFSSSINWVLIGKKKCNCFDSWDFNITLRACYGWLLSSPAKASHSVAQAWRKPRLAPHSQAFQVPDLQERAAMANLGTSSHDILGLPGTLPRRCFMCFSLDLSNILENKMEVTQVPSINNFLQVQTFYHYFFSQKLLGIKHQCSLSEFCIHCMKISVV